MPDGLSVLLLPPTHCCLIWFQRIRPAPRMGIRVKTTGLWKGRNSKKDLDWSFQNKMLSVILKAYLDWQTRSGHSKHFYYPKNQSPDLTIWELQKIGIFCTENGNSPWKPTTIPLQNARFFPRSQVQVFNSKIRLERWLEEFHTSIRYPLSKDHW